MDTSQSIAPEVKKKISIFRKVLSKLIRVQNINFWALVGFLPAFIVARLLVYHFPNLFLEINGVHVHHLTYGIFLLSIAGILALNIKSWRLKIFSALVYGVGLALSFDEFGMWLHLEDNYWVRQSYDALIIVTAILVNIVYFSFIWKRLIHVIRTKGEHPIPDGEIASGDIALLPAGDK